MNEGVPREQIVPPTVEELFNMIRQMRSVIDVQGKAIVNLNDNLGRVAKYAGMKVLNGRETLDG